MLLSFLVMMTNEVFLFCVFFFFFLWSLSPFLYSLSRNKISENGLRLLLDIVMSSTCRHLTLLE
jgi:hypothetical protein